MGYTERISDDCTEDMRREVRSVLEVLKPLFEALSGLRIAEIPESAQRVPKKLKEMGYAVENIYNRSSNTHSLSIFASKKEQPYGELEIYVTVNAKEFLPGIADPQTLYRSLDFTLSGDVAEKYASTFQKAVEDVLLEVFGKKENWGDYVEEIGVNKKRIFC